MPRLDPAWRGKSEAALGEIGQDGGLRLAPHQRREPCGPRDLQDVHGHRGSLGVAASWSFWMGRHGELPTSAPEGHAESGMEPRCEGKRKGVGDMAKHGSDGACDREVPPGQGPPVQRGAPLHPVHIEGGGNGNGYQREP